MGSWGILMHSAKGSSWEDHKYLKKEDGIYYYPDSYKGGRHLNSGSKKSSDSDSNSDEDSSSGGGGGLEDWEKNIHKHLADIIENNQDMFGTTDQISAAILDPRNNDAFKKTLKALTDFDVDKLSDADLSKMKKQIADYYYKDDGSGGGQSGSGDSGSSGGSSKSGRIGGSGGENSSSSSGSGKQFSQRDGDLVKEVAGFTGMKESQVRELRNLAKTKGTNSSEYKDKLDSLSEGDKKTAKRIEDTLNRYNKNASNTIFIPGKYLAHKTSTWAVIR